MVMDAPNHGGMHINYVYVLRGELAPRNEQ